MRLVDADKIKDKFLDMGCYGKNPCRGTEIVDRIATIETDDAISRKSVLNVCQKLWIGVGDFRQHSITSEIIKLPSIYPKERSGYLTLLKGSLSDGYYCSECDKKIVKKDDQEMAKKMKYCYNCGVKINEIKELEA